MRKKGKNESSTLKNLSDMLGKRKTPSHINRSMSDWKSHFLER